MPTIVDIRGVGPVLAKACVENGYASVERIATALLNELVVVPGVSEARAKQLIDAAKALLEEASPLNASPSNSDASPSVDARPDKEMKPSKKKKDKKKKKNKDKKKKGKKKGKKKNKK